MACCNNNGLTSFLATVSWRINKDIEQNLSITMTGGNGVWSGRNTSTFDITNGACCKSGQRGPNTNIRIQMNLECAETSTKAYVRGTIYVTIIGDTKFKIKLAYVELDCTKDQMAVWDILFAGILGEGRVVLSRL